MEGWTLKEIIWDANIAPGTGVVTRVFATMQTFDTTLLSSYYTRCGG